MTKTILEIISKIHKQKKDANKHPDYVTRKEIWTELFLQMDIELELLVERSILKHGDVINDLYYIKND